MYHIKYHIIPTNPQASTDGGSSLSSTIYKYVCFPMSWSVRNMVTKIIFWLIHLFYVLSLVVFVYYLLNGEYLLIWTSAGYTINLHNYYIKIQIYLIINKESRELALLTIVFGFLSSLSRSLNMKLWNIQL